MNARALGLRPSHTNGFTLVEILIALTLLSLVMLGLLSAMRTFAQTGERVEARLAKTDELRMVTAFVNQVLSSASTQPLPALPSNDGAVFLFSGEAQELVFVGTLPARHGPGGLHFLRLALWGPQERRILGLQFRPFDPLADRLDWAERPFEWLVEDVTRFELSYQPIEGGAWRARWHDPHALPGFVRLRLENTQGPWPEWVVPVRAALVGAAEETRP